MSSESHDARNSRRAAQDERYRRPESVVAQWGDMGEIDPDQLRWVETGAFWDLLESRKLTLLVTREDEHFVLALSASGGLPYMSVQPVPHPNGIAVDRAGGRVFVAATRNPNQIYEFRTAAGADERADGDTPDLSDRPLVPTRCAFFPGSLYLHDLALMGEDLIANAVGYNAVVRLDWSGQFELLWWPRCVEGEHGLRSERNYIQLNSIAPADDIEQSYFTASSSGIGTSFPGDADYRVDGTGVLFSGRTREPVCHGLTRPHSARTYRGEIWLANSGYGEVGPVRDGGFQALTRLPGWTRGLCFHDDVAFVATSPVRARTRHYAPGLDVEESRCGIHAVRTSSGEVLASLEFPEGRQIFALDWVPDELTRGFPAVVGEGAFSRSTFVYYSYRQRCSGADT